MTKSSFSSLSEIKTQTIVTSYPRNQAPINKQAKILPSNPNRVALVIASTASSYNFITPSLSKPSFTFGPFRINRAANLTLSLLDDGDLVTFPIWDYNTSSVGAVLIYETVRID